MKFTQGPHSALRDFRRRGLWLDIWLFGWALCIVLSLIHPPQVGIDVPAGDKIGHFLAYALLSAWSVLIFHQPRNHLLAPLSLVLLGIAMELAQGTFTSDRMMDVDDGIADALGVLVGQLLLPGRARLLLQRWDSRLFR